MSENSACAHLDVAYHRLKNSDGSYTGWWQCDSPDGCEMKFVPGVFHERILIDRDALVRYMREKRALRVSYLNPPDGKELDGARAAYEALTQELKDAIENERP